MKKWLLLVLMGVLLLNATQLTTSEAAPVKPILYFWGEGCPACKDVAPVIDKLIAGKYPVEKYEVYNDRNNMDRLAMLFKMNGVPEQDWAIPVAFYNGKMYMGAPNILALGKEVAPE